MKIRNLFLSVFFTLMTIGLVSCAKTEKDKVIESQKLMLEWVQSNNFVPDMKANIKAPQDLQTYMNKKAVEIAKKAGFKDLDEMIKSSEKFKEDKELKEISKKSEEVAKVKFKEVEQHMMQLMMQQQSQLPQQDQIAPTPTEEEKAK